MLKKTAFQWHRISQKYLMDFDNSFSRRFEWWELKDGYKKPALCFKNKNNH